MAAPQQSTSDTPASELTWQQRLRRPDLWREQLIDSALWLVLGLMVTHVIASALPGFPQTVWTESIKPGLYWVDRTDVIFARDKYVSFDFQPKLAYLDERYGQQRRHTKQIAGVQGDVVKVDNDWKIEVCHATFQGDVVCTPWGEVRKFDTAGRPMKSWVEPGSSYTIKAGELWAMGQHPQSLDSRYEGPISFKQVKGTAQMLFPFD